MSVRRKTVRSISPQGRPITTVYWVADYRDGAGRRHQERFEHKEKAQAHHDEQKVAVRAGKHVSIDGNMTVADVAEKWLKRVEADAVERATLRQYRQHVALHIVPRIGDRRLAKLSQAHVEDFRDGLISGVTRKDKAGKVHVVHEALSRPLARKVLVSFKSMLRVMRCSHLADDVTVEISDREKREKVSVEADRDFPTPEEVGRMVKATEPGSRLRALLMTATATGLRASELRGLRWQDVDLKIGELKVRQRADRWNEIGPPKSKKSRREIPLGPELSHALKEWKLGCPKGELDLVFPTDGGAVMHHKNMLNSIAPVMKAARIVKAGKPKYGLHAFRHFFASWCINPKDRGGRELPPKVVQTLLGHSSITMTLDVYGHLFSDGNNRAELAESEKKLFG